MRKALAVISFLVALFAVTYPVQAEEDGVLVGLHELRREGRLVCLVGHFHFGSASRKPSKKIAMKQAILDWRGFTSLEYGDHWGYWRYARNKTARCEKASAGWSCTVEGRPCKRYRRKRVVRRRR